MPCSFLAVSIWTAICQSMTVMKARHLLIWPNNCADLYRGFSKPDWGPVIFKKWKWKMEKGQTCSKWQMWIWWHGGKVASECGSLIKESLFSIPMLSILHADLCYLWCLKQPVVSSQQTSKCFVVHSSKWSVRCFWFCIQYWSVNTFWIRATNPNSNSVRFSNQKRRIVRVPDVSCHMLGQTKWQTGHRVTPRTCVYI